MAQLMSKSGFAQEITEGQAAPSPCVESFIVEMPGPKVNQLE